MVRVAAAALALTALSLYVLTFAPWFKHQYYGTPRERSLEDSEGLLLRVNGWQPYETPLLKALILLAVFAGIGAAAWLLGRRGDRMGVTACLVAVVAAGAGMLRIADELRAPSDVNYPHAVWGIYAALGAAVALLVASLAATLVAASTATSRQSLRPVWPGVGGVAAVYGLTLIAAAGEVWSPETIMIIPLAGAAGYAVGHWWLLLVPLPLGLLYGELTDVDGLGFYVLLFVIVMATAAVVAGVGARVLPRRLAATYASVP